jgi:hypothetical protein
MAKRSGGGGIQSRVNVKVPVRTGTPNRVVYPGGADQLGQHMGNHSTQSGRTLSNPATPLYGGKALSPTRMGNEIAQSTIAGVGGSRTIHARGSQSSSTPQPMAKGRDTLAEFGRDIPGRK